MENEGNLRLKVKVHLLRHLWLWAKHTVRAKANVVIADTLLELFR